MTPEEGITPERAAELLRRSVVPLPAERIPVALAHGRVLCEDLASPIDQPPFPRSPLDGYAFHAADSRGAGKDAPVRLKVVATVYAGDFCEREIRRGEAVRLMTGAPIPVGCDCVLRHEDTDNGRQTVALYKELEPWSNYCRAGEDFRRGELLLRAGTKLDAVALGVLAAAGLQGEGSCVTVYRKPRCAVFSTGDELVTGEVRPLPPGKIYSSNDVILRSRLQELGMEVIETPRLCIDSPERLAEQLRETAAHADVIFTTGGVSVGDRDFVPAALSLLGAERVFGGLHMKPGSPMRYSLYRGVPILSLSGNPFAAWATFELLGRELLAALSGTDTLLPQRLTGMLETAFPKSSKGRRFVRGTFHNGLVTLPEGHSSGQLASAVRSNCLVDIPAWSGPLNAGETVEVVLL